jgi:hypothetical protein
MSYINCGARINGERARTKKALREALTTDPSSVVFDPTSMFDSQAEIAGDAIPAGTTLSVVGPDPYARRNWYASVSSSNGKVSVK